MTTYLPGLKKILFVISCGIYVVLAGLSAALVSVGNESVFFAIILPFVIFPLLIVRNISLYGLKRLHVLLTPFIFVGTSFTTHMLATALGDEIVTETRDGLVQHSTFSVYYRAHYPFEGFEFLSFLALCFLCINVGRFGWFAKVP